MKFIRAIHWVLRQTLLRGRAPDSFDAMADKRPAGIKLLIGAFLGVLYGAYQRRRESLRLLRRNLAHKKIEYGILPQILQLSREILAILLFAFLCSLLLDWGVEEVGRLLATSKNDWVWQLADRLSFMVWPDIHFLSLLLEMSIGAISALLGLIFALYAVGFEVSTEKYSSEVSDYVNQEIVGNSFFKLLVFTDLYCILILLRTEIVDIAPTLSFIGAITLVAVCILGIVVFKNHYILTLKPKNLFERLLTDIREHIGVASARKEYTYQSWSITQFSRRRTARLLSLLKSLFEDLCRAGNWTDAAYAPIVLSYVLTDYSRQKKFIDREHGWWFPQKQTEVKASDPTTLPLKLNFELQGQGPLLIGKPDYEWFENQVSDIAQTFESRLEAKPGETYLVSQLIYCYQTILTGNYSQDEFKRYKKTILGLYENQEFETFGKYLDSFLALYSKVKRDDELGTYLNAFFAIGLVLMDGFDYTEYQRVIQSLVDPDGRLARDREEISAIDLPSMFYDQLLDYWDRLDLEVECEGKVVTPKHQIERETLGECRQKEKAYFDRFFGKLCSHQDMIMADLQKKNMHKELGSLLKIRLEWFSRLLYLKKADVAEQYAPMLMSERLHLLSIPKQILLESEFWEEIEKLAFPSVIENCRGLFKEITRMLVLLISVLNADEKNIDNLVYRNRLALVIGGFVYLVSELHQRRDLLIEYVRIMERSYKEGYFVQMLEMLANPKDVGGLSLTIKLINWETTRYHHWFAHILRRISELPKRYGEVRPYAGMQKIADHASELVREISFRSFSPEKESIEAYVEWTKKREVVKEIVAILGGLGARKR